MSFRKAARGIFIGSISLLAASCATSTGQQSPTEPGDNGAFCSGTPANKKACEDNQSRMTDGPIL